MRSYLLEHLSALARRSVREIVLPQSRLAVVAALATAYGKGD